MILPNVRHTSPREYVPFTLIPESPFFRVRLTVRAVVSFVLLASNTRISFFSVSP